VNFSLPELASLQYQMQEMSQQKFKNNQLIEIGLKQEQRDGEYAHCTI
jgi:hypothetical protein